jgi:DNA replication initiation complex subunit (GINS family)
MAKTFEEWYATYDDESQYLDGMKDAYDAAWHARDTEVAALTAERDTARGKLERIEKRLHQIIEVRGERDKVLIAAEAGLAALEGKE